MRILKEWGTGLGALLTALGLILNTIVPERQNLTLTIAGFGAALLLSGIVLNWSAIVAAVRGRRLRAASASVGYTLTVLAVVVLVNFLSGRHHKRFDLTENQAFSLSEQTIKILEGLTRDVSITSFTRETDPGYQKQKDLLDEYSYRSRHLQVKFIDPDRNPGEVKRYNVTEIGTVILESGKTETRTTTSDEESLTNALIKVTSDRERVIYFVNGHGEHSVDDNGRDGLSLLKGVMEKQNYVVKPLVLAQGVPADTSAVVIAGADKPYLESEVKMIGDYVAGGGRLLLLQDPGSDPGLGPLLAGFGAAVRHDVVIDKVSQLFGGDARMPMVAPDAYDTSSPITKTFAYQTVYPLASSIDVKEPAPDGVTAVKLAHTSPLSWGETSEQEVQSGSIQLDDGVDTRGPLTVAAAFERKAPASATPEPAPAANPESAPKPEGRASRLVVFGDADFISNNYFNAGGNGDLALNSIAWLVEQGELISIRPKASNPSLAVMSPGQKLYYLWSIVVVAPLGIAAAGVAIWWRRKRL
ncbi:MAG TPA: GldG family protein [Candidatus Polarisedimenticolia bacterium]|nr:GldG family protein [Candidatus Polarisedimenticolia bacterium]